nr:serine/threonine-protein kinase [Deltaproteobacteria bacterium]
MAHAFLWLLSSSTSSPAVHGSNPAELSTWGAPEFESRQREITAPGAKVGRYVLTEWIGAGAMGSVFAAHDPMLDRPVALKVLHPTRRTQKSAERLLREARALAKLSHPNIVTINDVGIDGDRLYLAMELVEGQTLSQWIAKGPWDWPHVLDVMEQVGRGLAAVHDADIVHRDFKPDNVMITAGDQVRIADFGIAQFAQPSGLEESTLVASLGGGAIAEAEAQAELERQELELSPGSATGSAEPIRLTRTGALLGTPRYMAPEQFMRSTIDARSDQYAYCLMLWEALYCEHPRAGVGMPELAVAVTSGVLPTPPATKVPPWLVRLMLQGLALDPDRRHGSMHALLGQMVRARARRRHRRGALASMALVAAVGGGATAWWAVGEPSTTCDAQERMAGVWDDEVAARLDRAFAATGLPLAAASRVRVIEHLDAYRDGWMAGYLEACRARARADGPALDALDGRIACLNDRRRGLEQLVRVFADADQTVVENAEIAALSLDDVGSCEDLDPQGDELLPSPELRVRVDRVEGLVAEAEALASAGLFARALERLEQAQQSASGLEHGPLDAKIWLQRGMVESWLGKQDQGVGSLERAVALAAEVGLDAMVAKASLELADVHVTRHSEPEVALRWVRNADAALERYGASPLEHALRDDTMAEIELYRARWAEAESLLRRSLALRREALGNDSMPVAASYSQLSRLETRRGAYDVAIAYLDQALSIRRAVLGEHHPLVTSTLATIQDVYRAKGDYARAHEYDDLVLPRLEAAYGAKHPILGSALVRRGALLGSEGYSEDALGFLDRGLEITEFIDGPEHPNVAIVLSNRGVVLSKLGRHEETIECQRRALRISEASFPPDHPRVAMVLDNLGNALVEAGRPTEALPLHRRALPIWERKAPGSSSLAISLTDHAHALLAVGEPGPAV